MSTNGNKKAELDKARTKTLERALKEERTAILAVVMAVLRESAVDPERLLARLEAMGAAAAGRSKGKEKERQQRDLFVAAEKYVRNALAIEAGRPQQLFEPNVGHTKPEEVETLADGFGTQMALETPEDTHRALSEAEEDTDRKIIAALEHSTSALTDADLAERVAAPGSLVRTRRAALTQSGRLVNGERRNGTPTFNLVEREQIA